MTKWITLGLVLALVGGVVNGVATSNNGTSVPDATATAPQAPTTTAKVPTLGVPAHLVGSGYRNYGTLHVSRPSVLRWRVTGMAPNSAFFNIRYWAAGRPGCTKQLVGPAHYLSFTTTDQPTGSVPVPRGTYQCFTVDSSRTPERWAVSLKAR
jgi:hypothetical protein